MNVGMALKIAKDLIILLETDGILQTDGTFDQSKLDTLSEDVAFVADVELVLEAHGIHLPGKARQLIQALPGIVLLFGN